MRLVLVLVVVGLVSGCFTGGARREIMRRLPRSMICDDGFPVKILVGRDCPDGFCGYTCVPGRWTPETDQ